MRLDQTQEKEANVENANENDNNTAELRERVFKKKFLQIRQFYGFQKNVQFRTSRSGASNHQGKCRKSINCLQC